MLVSYLGHTDGMSVKTKKIPLLIKTRGIKN
jgi:hypothetical protein